MQRIAVIDELFLLLQFDTQDFGNYHRTNWYLLGGTKNFRSPSLALRRMSATRIIDEYYGESVSDRGSNSCRISLALNQARRGFLLGRLEEPTGNEKSDYNRSFFGVPPFLRDIRIHSPRLQ